MLLVNTVKNDKAAFDLVTAALIDLVYGNAHSLYINKVAAGGMFTHTMTQLKRMSQEAKYHFPITDIRLPHCVDADQIRLMAQAKGGIVVIDEAHGLDRIEGAAEALRALESPYLKVVYVGTVFESELLEA